MLCRHIIMMAADAGSPSLLILLDLTAAFDTVDHSILLYRLRHTISLSGSVYNWFSSYLTGRMEYVALGEAKSVTHNVTCGVPQGSVLGPLLFILYMLPLGYVISRHGISFHCYADDTQLYLKTNSSTSAALSSSTMTTCLEEVEAWMSQNFLQLNGLKDWGYSSRHPSLDPDICNFQCYLFLAKIFHSQHQLQIWVLKWTHLTFETHVKQLCKTSLFHLRNIARLRPMLSIADAEKLVHAFVSSRLDYCNALLIRYPWQKPTEIAIHPE